MSGQGTPERPPDVVEPRWLDGDEQYAWRQLAGVLLKLPVELERQLQRDACMTHFEYWVIAMLSEAPDRTLRLSELAELANASLSRLSHVMTRLEQRGWVERRPCEDDRRSTYGVLTDAGWEQVVAAAPGHVEAVRSLVLDGLDPTDVKELGRLCEAILARVNPVL